MKLESANAHELRTMPEAFHQSPRGNGGNWSWLQISKQWRVEMDREHNRRWNTDPQYRQECMEREAALREAERGNYLSQ